MSIRTGTLTHFQIQAARMMLEGQTLAAISIQVQKDIATIKRWGALPAFIEMMKVGKLAAFSETAIRLSSSMHLSAAVLEEIMLDPDTKPGDRIKAAIEILNYSLRLSDNLDLQYRIQLLETAAAVDVDILEGIECHD